MIDPMEANLADPNRPSGFGCYEPNRTPAKHPGTGQVFWIETGCGNCLACGIKKARAKQAPIIAEVLTAEAQLYDWQFMTLTFGDESLPYTEPVPVPLGYQITRDAQGKQLLTKWKGPLYRPHSESTELRPKGDHLVRDHDGSYLRSGGRELDWEQEHWLHLTRVKKLSDEQIRRLTEGDYEPEQTINWYRLNRWLRRIHRAFGKAPRYVAAGEYGGITERPHFHVLMNITPHQLGPVLEMWMDQNEGTTVTDPKLAEWQRNPYCSHLRDLEHVGSYVTKDFVKSLHRRIHTASRLIAERPGIRGSKRPALGDGFIPTWLKVAESVWADAQLGSHDRARQVALLREGLAGVRLLGNRFKTPRRWNEAAFQHLGLDQADRYGAYELELERDANWQYLIDNDIDGYGAKRQEISDHDRKYYVKADEAYEARQEQKRANLHRRGWKGARRLVAGSEDSTP